MQWEGENGRKKLREEGLWRRQSGMKASAREAEVEGWRKGERKNAGVKKRKGNEGKQKETHSTRRVAGFDFVVGLDRCCYHGYRAVPRCSTTDYLCQGSLPASKLGAQTETRITLTGVAMVFRVSLSQKFQQFFHTEFTRCERYSIFILETRIRFIESILFSISSSKISYRRIRRMIKSRTQKLQTESSTMLSKT